MEIGSSSMDVPLIPKSEGAGSERWSWFLGPVMFVWNNGYACGVAKAGAFALYAYFVKSLRNNIPAFEMLLVRAIVSIFLIIPAGLFVNFRMAKKHGYAITNRPLIYTNGDSIPLLFLVAIFFGLAVAFEFNSFHLIPATDTKAVMDVAPAIAAFLGRALKGEPCGWPTFLGFSVSYIGVIIIGKPSFLLHNFKQMGKAQVFGVLLGLMSALCISLYSITMRFIGKREMFFTAVIWINFGLLVVPIMPLVMGWPRPIELRIGMWELLWAIGIVKTVLIGEVFMFRTLQHLHAAMGLAMDHLVFVIMAVIGWIVLGERLSIIGFGGCGLIACGLLIMGLEPRRTDGQQVDDRINAIP